MSAQKDSQAKLTLMNCEQARNLFDAYLDGELSSAQETELGAHRIQCADCRHELALLEVIGHVVSATDDRQPQLDDGFTDRLLACLDRPQPKTSSRYVRRLLIGIPSLAAAAAIVLAVTLVMQKPEPRVLGEKHVNPDAPSPLDSAANSLVQQVESTWSQRVDHANEIIHFGEMTIMQVLDRLGIDETGKPADEFELMPPSFDELAPVSGGDQQVNDL